MSQTMQMTDDDFKALGYEATLLGPWHSAWSKTLDDGREVLVSRPEDDKSEEEEGRKGLPNPHGPFSIALYDGGDDFRGAVVVERGPVAVAALRAILPSLEALDFKA